MMLGDIAVSFQTVQTEARAENKPFAHHYQHMVVHGLLHLLGFDHEKFTYRYAGRDFRLTDVKGNVVKEVLA